MDEVKHVFRETTTTSHSRECKFRRITDGQKLTSHVFGLLRKSKVKQGFSFRCHRFGTETARPTKFIFLRSLLYGTRVKLKARGPNVARHVILCGPRELKRCIKISLCYFTRFDRTTTTTTTTATTTASYVTETVQGEEDHPEVFPRYPASAHSFSS